MGNLFHASSLAHFVTQWKSSHPGATVIDRDLTA
jgi:hypothetical protein